MDANAQPSQSSSEATEACTCSTVPPTMPTCRDYHLLDCPAATTQDRMRYAREMLADPARAAVEMSGMSTADLRELRREFG